MEWHVEGEGGIEGIKGSQEHLGGGEEQRAERGPVRVGDVTNAAQRLLRDHQHVHWRLSETSMLIVCTSKKSLFLIK